MTRLLTLLAGLIAVSGHGLAAQNGHTVPGSVDDEIAIYRAVLDSIFTGRFTRALVVADTAMSLTIPADSVSYVATRQLYPPVPGGAIADFIKKSEHPSPQIEVRARVPVHRISRREFHRIIDGRPHDTAWSEFYRRFGNATEMLVLSRIGFDGSRQHALVTITSYSHTYSNPVSGSVAYVVRRPDGQWELGQWRLLWLR